MKPALLPLPSRIRVLSVEPLRALLSKANLQEPLYRPRKAHLPTLSITTVELLCLRLPLYHRVHSFQMGRVGYQRQRDVSVGDTVDPLVVHAQMVFDIARALRGKMGYDEPTSPRGE